MTRITAIATEARVTRTTSHGVSCPLRFSSFLGGAVLVLVSLEVIAVVLVSLDGVVGPREVVVMFPLEVIAVVLVPLGDVVCPRVVAVVLALEVTAK